MADSSFIDKKNICLIGAAIVCFVFVFAVIGLLRRWIATPLPKLGRKPKRARKRKRFGVEKSKKPKKNSSQTDNEEHPVNEISQSETGKVDKQPENIKAGQNSSNRTSSQKTLDETIKVENERPEQSETPNEIENNKQMQHERSPKVVTAKASNKDKQSFSNDFFLYDLNKDTLEESSADEQFEETEDESKTDIKYSVNQNSTEISKVNILFYKLESQESSADEFVEEDDQTESDIKHIAVLDWTESSKLNVAMLEVENKESSADEFVEEDDRTESDVKHGADLNLKVSSNLNVAEYKLKGQEPLVDECIEGTEDKFETAIKHGENQSSKLNVANVNLEDQESPVPEFNEDIGDRKHLVPNYNESFQKTDPSSLNGEEDIRNSQQSSIDLNQNQNESHKNENEFPGAFIAGYPPEDQDPSAGKFIDENKDELLASEIVKFKDMHIPRHVHPESSSNEKACDKYNSALKDQMSSSCMFEDSVISTSRCDPNVENTEMMEETFNVLSGGMLDNWKDSADNIEGKAENESTYTVCSMQLSDSIEIPEESVQDGNDIH